MNIRYSAFLLFLCISVVVAQHYHYYNLTQDPLESNNLYNDPASGAIVASLELSGTQWLSQVGLPEYPGSITR